MKRTWWTIECNCRRISCQSVPIGNGCPSSMKEFLIWFQQWRNGLGSILPSSCSWIGKYFFEHCFHLTFIHLINSIQLWSLSPHYSLFLNDSNGFQMHLPILNGLRGECTDSLFQVRYRTHVICCRFIPSNGKISWIDLTSTMLNVHLSNIRTL